MNIKITEKDDPQTRLLDDKHGEKQEVTVPKRFWDYFDWLGENGEDNRNIVKAAIIFRAHHKNRLSFDHQFMAQLHWDERSRYLTGKKCPLLITPEGYNHEDYLGSPSQGGYNPIGRVLKNAFGIDETAIMNGIYWEYLDWGTEQGFDNEAWVKHVDEKRPHDTSFGHHLTFAIWHDMCNRYRRGDPYPFDRPPNGYQE